MSASPSSEPLIGDIEHFLQEMIEKLQASKSAQPGPGRPAIVPAFCLWAGLLVCVLRGMSSQLALWRLLSVTGLWNYPHFAVCDQAIYNRLAKGGTEPLQRFFQQLNQLLRERLAPFALNSLAPFAKAVYALDETHLDKVARTLPALRKVPAGDARLLPGKLAGLFDLRLQQWRCLEYIPEPKQNEKVMARRMVEALPQKSLILTDLGYFGFAWFDWLTNRGYYWISRLRAKTSYIVLHCFYQQGDLFDGLVFLGKHRADQAAHAVRLVQFRVGKRTYRYITNVLDPKLLPIADIAQLYARRWDIELAFKLVKRHLKLHLLWSAKIVVIQQQIWAVLIISQILQALRMEIAGRAQVDPYEVSMALLVQYGPDFARDGQDPVKVFVERGRQARFIRPSTRTTIQAPVIAHDSIEPMPDDLVLTRKPRYAQRKCHRRTNRLN